MTGNLIESLKMMLIFIPFLITVDASDSHGSFYRTSNVDKKAYTQLELWISTMSSILLNPNTSGYFLFYDNDSNSHCRAPLLSQGSMKYFVLNQLFPQLRQIHS